ncbi:HemK2/MTQ2 family protein methyltransferase [Streptomyces sp. NPDC001822]|uniref:HemK2/MTQ2 family protein methyltransferase n=1 Tax=Streptomyces sp. NPDC001822 TaxID=3364614 RepID=UPI0036ADD705
MRVTAAARTEAWARPSRVLRLPGVYRAQADSSFLAAAMRREGIGSGMEVLDLCTGSGSVALHAARLGAQVTAVDISRRAVISARVNASVAGLQVAVRRGDLFSAYPGRRFDAVVSNPPYVPSPDPRVPRRGASRAWNAGCDGRALLDRICDAAPAALRPGGLLLLVHSELNRPEETVRQLVMGGLKASVIDHASVPFGPIMRTRMNWLKERGLVSAAERRRERLVIIRADKL